MKLIAVGTAARMLGLDPSSLRRRESADGHHADVYGHRIRVWRTGLGPRAQRRYDADEIYRILARLGKAK